MFVEKRTEESEASQKKQSTNRLHPTLDFEQMMADPVFNKTVTEHTNLSSAGQFEVVTPQPPTYKEQDLQESHQVRRFEHNDSGEESPMKNFVSPSSGPCSGLDVKDTGTPLRVTTKKYERKRSVEIDDDIQEIKTRVKVLQKRLDNIEKPLLEIIERLSRK